MSNNTNIPNTSKKIGSGRKIEAKTNAYFSFDIEVSPIVDNHTVQMEAEDIIIAKHMDSYQGYKPGEAENKEKEMIIRFTGKDYVHNIEDEKTKIKTFEHAVTKKDGNWYSVSLSLLKLKKYFPDGKFSMLIAPKDGKPPIPLYTELNSNNPFEIPKEAELAKDDETEPSAEKEPSAENKNQTATENK